MNCDLIVNFVAEMFLIVKESFHLLLKRISDR